MTKPYDLGILLVHGIGTQPAGDTITSWGDTLVKTIAAATNRRVNAVVERAGPDLKGGDGEREEASLKLGNERWLLAEGWWAESFIAPSYREFFSWSLRALPWALAMHSAQRYWAVTSKTVRKLDVARFAVLKLSYGLLIAPLVFTVLFLILVLGIVPIPGLRGALLAAQRLFTATVGDSLVFVESPVRSGLIKSRILNALEALQARCEKTIVLAHSQGAAASVEALGGIAGLNDPPAQQANTLVTFGAGTNQLSVLRRSETLPTTVGGNPLRWALAGAFLVAGATTYLISQVLAHRLAPEKVALAFLLWGLLGLVTAAVAIGGTRLSRRLESTKPSLAASAGRAAIVGSIVVALLGVFGFYALGGPLGIPFTPFVALVIAFGIMVVSVVTLLSKDWERIMTTVRYPPGLERWIDIHASADPIAAAPTLTREQRRPGEPHIVDALVWNEGSLITDHIRYWKNRDEFVLRVVRACAETAGSPWLAVLPADWTRIDDRANWRVSWLRLMRVAFTTTAIGLGVALYHSSFDMVCRLADAMPSWLVNRLARPDLESGSLLALIAAGAMAGYLLSRSVWRRWVDTEQTAILAQKSPQGLERVPLFAMGTIAWAALITAARLTFWNFLTPIGTTAPMDLRQGGVQAGLILLGAIVMSAIATFFLKRLNPPPQPPSGKVASALQTRAT